MLTGQSNLLPQSVRMFHYRLFGLPFETPEPIPGLEASSPGDEPVCVQFGVVPGCLERPDYCSASVFATGNEYLFSHPELVRIYVRGASQIVVQRGEACDPVQAWGFVLGIGASIAGVRRGFVPLHASAIEALGGCVALAGQSCFGKSTLAAAMLALGFRLHADDLCLVQPRSGVPPLVGSGVRETRLDGSAATALAWTQAPFATLSGSGKHIYRMIETGASLLPLKRIYALGYADEENPAGIFRLHGVDAMRAIIGCLRLDMTLLSVIARQQIFESLAAVTDATEVWRFVRPFDAHQIKPWAERLATHLSV